MRFLTLQVRLVTRWDEPLEAPAGVTAEQVGVPRWRPGLTFGEFAELTVQGYYQPAAPAG